MGARHPNNSCPLGRWVCDLLVEENHGSVVCDMSESQVGIHVDDGWSSGDI